MTRPGRSRVWPGFPGGSEVQVPLCVLTLTRGVPGLKEETREDTAGGGG